MTLATSKDVRRAKWIFAFPGLGKTYLSERDQRYVDLDGGDLRNALKLEKGDPYIMEVLREVARRHLAKGKVILNNEPELLDFACARVRALVVLPLLGVNELAQRIRARGGTDQSKFADMVEKDGARWISDWERRAVELGVPVRRVEYLSDLVGIEPNPGPPPSSAELESMFPGFNYSALMVALDRLHYVVAEPPDVPSPYDLTALPPGVRATYIGDDLVYYAEYTPPERMSIEPRDDADDEPPPLQEVPTRDAPGRLKRRRTE